MSSSLLYPQLSWIKEISGPWDKSRSAESLMELMHKIAFGSVERGGGPFAAAVTHPDGKIVEINVNSVVLYNDCGAHAEGIAMPNAQRILCSSGRKVRDLHGFHLYTSGMPCTGCAGRVWLFRPSKVYASVSKDLIEANSPFTEGPIATDFWTRAKKERDIELIENFGFGDGVLALKPFKAFTQAIKEGKVESYLEK